MLKTLAMLALLAAGLPIYGSEEGPKAHANKNHAPPEQVTQPVVIVNSVEQPATKAQGGQAEEHPKSYLSRLFSPENLPNIGLFFAGIIGIGVATATLLAIKRQSDLMKEQSDMARGKERPRLRVELGDVELGPKVGVFGLGVNWKLSIYGTTEAFIESSTCHCCIGKRDGFQQPRYPDPTGLPDVILPRGKAIEPFATLMSADSSYPIQPESDELEAIKRGENLIYCFGCIEYTNVFDEKWVLRFSRVYEMMQLPRHEFFGIWTNYGQPEANREYKVEKPLPPKHIWFHWAVAKLKNPAKPN